MQYLFLAYGNEKSLAALPSAEHDAFEEARLSYVKRLQQSGRLVAEVDLQDGSIVTTVRFLNGQVAVTAGLASQTNEPLKGLFIIEARDLNEAIRVAMQLPPARSGLIEVRSLTEFEAG